MTNELSMTRGDSTTFRITVLNNSVAFDLTGYACQLTVKSKDSDPNASALIGPLTGAIVVAADGTIDFPVLKTESEVETGTYDYDVEVTKDDDVFTVVSSTFTIKLDTTRTEELEDEELYLTPVELRTFLQYDENDYPNKEDMRFMIKLSMKKIALDLDSSDENILFIATLLLAKTNILRSLATRSIRTGYIQVNAEGRTITKAYQEFVLDAENSLQEYKEFILSVGRVESISTNFMTKNEISSYTREQIIDMMNGTTNAEQAQYGRKYDYFWRR
jgi:hypothetical protein